MLSAQQQRVPFLSLLMLGRNAHESRTQANMMNNRGSFRVISFAILCNTKHWSDKGGDSACPPILILSLAIMT